MNRHPHLSIRRLADYATQGAPWFVFSDIPDSDGDYTWGHFPTHAEAVAFVAAVTR